MWASYCFCDPSSNATEAYSLPAGFEPEQNRSTPRLIAMHFRIAIRLRLLLSGMPTYCEDDNSNACHSLRSSPPKLPPRLLHVAVQRSDRDRRNDDYAWTLQDTLLAVGTVPVNRAAPFNKLLWQLCSA